MWARETSSYVPVPFPIDLVIHSSIGMKLKRDATIKSRGYDGFTLLNISLSLIHQVVHHHARDASQIPS